MAKDAQRREMILHELQMSRLEASFSPTEVLLLTGYWPGGIGFTSADSHALPRVHPECNDMLEAGMTFHIEPAIYLEKIGGMRRCDVVACTDNGVEVLTDF